MSLWRYFPHQSLFAHCEPQLFESPYYSLGLLKCHRIYILSDVFRLWLKALSYVTAVVPLVTNISDTRIHSNAAEMGTLTGMVLAPVLSVLIHIFVSLLIDDECYFRTDPFSSVSIVLKVGAAWVGNTALVKLFVQLQTLDLANKSLRKLCYLRKRWLCQKKNHPYPGISDQLYLNIR